MTHEVITTVWGKHTCQQRTDGDWDVYWQGKWAFQMSDPLMKTNPVGRIGEWHYSNAAIAPLKKATVVGGLSID